MTSRAAARPGIRKNTASMICFTDDFNRSDRAINGDNGWSCPSNGLSIVSNQLSSTLTPVFAIYLVTRPTGTTGWCSADFIEANLYNQPIKLVFRGAGGLIVQSNGIFFDDGVNPTVTIDSVARTGFTGNLKIEWTPTTVKCYVAGVLVYSANNSANATAINVGVQVFRDNHVPPTIVDNFATCYL